MNEQAKFKAFQYAPALLFLIFPVIQTLNEPSVIRQIVNGAVILLYILSVIYLIEWSGKYRKAVWLILLLSISVMMQYINLGMVGFFLFPVFMLSFGMGQKLSSFYGLSLIIVIALNTTYAIISQPLAALDLLPFVIFIYLMMITSGYYAEHTRLVAELSEKNSKLAKVSKELERNRIAQDLHDTLGHVFSTLSVKTQLATKLIDVDAEMAKQELNEINDITKQALFSVRQIVEGVNGTSLDEEAEFAKNLLKNAGIEANIQVSAVPFEKQHDMVMMLRELTNNIIKHSQATHVRIEIEKQDEDIHLIAEDNGIGLSSGKTIRSIEERVDKLQGQLKYYQLAPGLKIEILIGGQ